jgi:hypothetical protein
MNSFPDWSTARLKALKRIPGKGWSFSGASIAVPKLVIASGHHNIHTTNRLNATETARLIKTIFFIFVLRKIISFCIGSSNEK